MYLYFQCILLMTFNFQSASSFLLDDACQTPVPCTCDSANIWCTGYGLTTVPKFTANDELGSTLRIHLNFNDIQQIPAKAFFSLHTANVTNFEIDLAENELNSIDDDAFNGIETAIKLLVLDGNNLTSIPDALQELTNLETLSIRHNHIMSFSSPTVLQLSRTITSLAISMDLFSEWPRELHYFRVLAKLYVDGFPEPRLPLDALSGQELTMLVLEISRSELDRIPSAVCHLKHLKHFSYISNYKTIAPVFEPCNHNLTSITYLSLQDNNLQQFPKVLDSFVALGYLDVSHNSIRTIHSYLVPMNQPLTHVELSWNSLRRIPSALTHLQNVKLMDLSHNQITSLEDYDLFKLSDLRALSVSDNPIEYVSIEAFQSQNMIGSLNFSRTYLEEIPPAVLTLSQVRVLDLTGAPIDCTCGMSSMTNSSIAAVSIVGTCAGTGENITYFRETFLLLCPS